ncbi:L-2-hydroxyglutarate oxidase [Raineyella antarctica]|uniref:L-2-hydroxyglutarate oxidase n=1 Tax=Raineyella antarctica TaxID=1577474 RepID=A0A1G6IFT5_9ACTN|nr:L-2-hydroxyglutarate oxidase [Raineyella antarctica]SDC05260.1 L-2-hydroxyglutarate oxidase [Raineyella antarctica]
MTTDATFDYCIIGGGIVGVATAWNILRETPTASVVLLEKERRLAAHQTGHNSGVIHAGIYYEPGSLKARLCRQGSAWTKQYATEKGIPFRECGKMLVATNALELDRMAGLVDRAERNGITYERLDAAQLAEREPNVRGLGALFLRETGIIDYTRVTEALAEDIVRAGAEVVTGVEVDEIVERPDLVTVSAGTGTWRCRTLIACAGLQSDRIAALAGLDIDFQILPFRGEYYTLPPERSDLVSHLIYPIPDPDLPFLGVHVSPTIHGRLTVGPNAVLGFAREKYQPLGIDVRDVAEMLRFPGLLKVAAANLVTGAKEMRNSLWKRGYLRECRKYLPAIRLDDLQERSAGIRAQAVMNDGTFVHDFLIRRTDRMVHVVNAPSPAATSALPIGQMIARQAANPSVP